jgi:hypothetical protein
MIYQYTLDGELINTYKTLKEAAQAVGLSKSRISECTSGRCQKAGKFYWKSDKPKKYLNVDNQVIEKFHTFDQEFMSQEMIYFRHEVAKTKKTHIIYCYNPDTAIALTNKIAEFKRWACDWYYNILDKVYVVDCRRLS